MAVRQSERSEKPRPSGGRGGASPSWLAFLVTLAACLAAGAAVHYLRGTLGWAVAVAVALAGSVFGTSIAGSGANGESRARRLLATLYAEDGADDRALWEEAPGAWGELYQRMKDLLEEKLTFQSAFSELERAKRHVELATLNLREGKDPLTEVAELRVGPLHDLLDAVRDSSGQGPVVSRLTLGEDELIGTGGDALPAAWPASGADRPVLDDRSRAEASRGMDELVRGLERLAEAMSVPSSSAGSSGESRTPAQLVDAVVHTAADGIEDLAAGLMRASELASVAERVTNRATLLALNAALEATRSGSEAFASIAEETRRLAEFAREATDTISRLAGEIEYKVGETITAIHATSEDAKSAVAALSGGAVVPIVPAAHRGAVQSLLTRARAIRDEWAAAASSAGSETDLPPVAARSSAAVASPEPDAAFGGEDAADSDEPPPPLELAPRYEGAPGSGVPHDLAPDPAPPGDASDPDYLRLLDRLKPGA
jgi:hypothetical protein